MLILSTFKENEMSVANIDAAMRRLADLAERVGRTREDLAAEAIDAYVDVQDWQLRGIEEALVALDAENWLAHEDIENWVASINAPVPTSPRR
jgi:predicted transcriptional regulator